MVADFVVSGWLAWPGLGPAADLLFFASPKKSRQKKGEPDALSRSDAAGTLRCSVRAGSAQTCPLRGLRTCAALIRPALRYSPAHDGKTRVRASPRFIGVVFGGRVTFPFPSSCRVTGLSSAAASGSGRALSERSEFSPTPLDASSARHRAAARASARLFFAYFLLAKQKKVRRRRGETRHVSVAKALDQKEKQRNEP